MLGRSAPCLHPCSPNTSQHRLCWFPPHPQPAMGWDGKGVSNPGCGEEPLCRSCPWTWEGSPSAGGHSTGDQPRQSELPLCPRSRPHPRCASTSAPPLPRAAIASPAWKTQLALLRSGHSTELPGQQQRPGHGRATERIGKGWILGAQGVRSLPRLPCAAFPAAPCMFLLPHACPGPAAPAGSETLPRAGTSQAEPMLRAGLTAPLCKTMELYPQIPAWTSSFTPSQSSSTASPCRRTGGTGTCSTLLLPQPGFIHFSSIKKPLITRIFKQWR